MAISARQRRAAVEARGLARVAVGVDAGVGLDRAADDTAGRRIAKRFELAHPRPPCPRQY
jgi:hypothetical protein